MGVEQVRKIVGNNRKIKLSKNCGVVMIVGNNTKIYVKVNEGSISYTGNNGHVLVEENMGNIQYTGNDGRVEIGGDSKGNVNFTGNGGVLVDFVPRDSKKERPQTPENKESQKKPSKRVKNDESQKHYGGVRTCNGQIIFTKETTTGGCRSKFEMHDWCLNFTSGIIISV